MLFVAAGVRRSASTLVFQIACAILDNDKRRIRRWNNTARRDIFSENGWWVTKSHNYLHVAHKNPGRVKAYLTIRDPRDIMVSMMTLHNENFERTLNRGLLSRDFFQFWTWLDKVPDDCVVRRYEDIYQDLPFLVQDIAEVMGKELSEKRVEELAEKYSFERNKERSDTTGNTRADMLFPGHLQTGETGMWKKALLPEQANRVAQLAGEDFLEEWGYETT